MGLSTNNTNVLETDLLNEILILENCLFKIKKEFSNVNSKISNCKDTMSSTAFKKIIDSKVSSNVLELLNSLFIQMENYKTNIGV